MVIVIEIYKILYKLNIYKAYAAQLVWIIEWKLQFNCNTGRQWKIDGRRFILGKAMDIAI